MQGRRSRILKLVRKMAVQGTVGRRRAEEMGRAGETRAHGWHGSQAGEAVGIKRDGLIVAVAADVAVEADLPGKRQDSLAVWGLGQDGVNEVGCEVRSPVGPA